MKYFIISALLFCLSTYAIASDSLVGTYTKIEGDIEATVNINQIKDEIYSIDIYVEENAHLCEWVGIMKLNQENGNYFDATDGDSQIIIEPINSSTLIIKYKDLNNSQYCGIKASFDGIEVQKSK